MFYLVIELVDLIVSYELGSCICGYDMNSYTLLVYIKTGSSCIFYGSNMLFNMLTWLYLTMLVFFLICYFLNVPFCMISILCVHIFPYLVQSMYLPLFLPFSPKHFRFRSLKGL